eukprot:scaffold83181_cov25-Tisochrysis_lutea.AAC.6
MSFRRAPEPSTALLTGAAPLQVVCICNDRSNAKVRSLANHCLDLRFRRPSPSEIATALQRIATAEGYVTDKAALEKIAVACNADLRQMLNLLQARPQLAALAALGASCMRAG